MPRDREYDVLLEKSGLQGVELAGLLGVAPMTVSRWSMEGPAGFDPPWYALNFLRAYLMLPTAARDQLPRRIAAKPLPKKKA